MVLYTIEESQADASGSKSVIILTPNTIIVVYYSLLDFNRSKYAIEQPNNSKKLPYLDPKTFAAKASISDLTRRFYIAGLRRAHSLYALDSRSQAVNTKARNVRNLSKGSGFCLEYSNLDMTFVPPEVESTLCELSIADGFARTTDYCFSLDS